MTGQGVSGGHKYYTPVVFDDERRARFVSWVSFFELMAESGRRKTPAKAGLGGRTLGQSQDAINFEFLDQICDDVGI